MAVNKLTFTINSRQYTVVAEESTEYLERLCSHVNEKVENVLRGGQNIMGERPIVLAALNICDEYYKKSEEVSALKETQDKLNSANNQIRTLEEQKRQLESKLRELEERARRPVQNGAGQFNKR